MLIYLFTSNLRNYNIVIILFYEEKVLSSTQMILKTNESLELYTKSERRPHIKSLCVHVMIPE